MLHEKKTIGTIWSYFAAFLTFLVVSAGFLGNPYVGLLIPLLIMMDLLDFPLEISSVAFGVGAVCARAIIRVTNRYWFEIRLSKPSLFVLLTCVFSILIASLIVEIW